MSRYSPSGNCCGCLVFEDGFSPPAESWNVVSGSLTPTTYSPSGTPRPAIELSSGTIALVSRSVPASGKVQATMGVPSGTALGVVFGYLDEDNFNLAIIEWAIHPVSGLLTRSSRYYEYRGGSASPVTPANFGITSDAFPVCWTLYGATSHLLTFGFHAAGVSSLPGTRVGVYCPTGPAYLYSPADFGAYKQTTLVAPVGDNTCACRAHCPTCIESSPALELRVTYAGMDGAGLICFNKTSVHPFNFFTSRPGGTMLPSLCSWGMSTAFGDGTSYASTDEFVRIVQTDGEYFLIVARAQIQWKKSLGMDLPQSWTLDETLDFSHLQHNFEGCVLDAATVRVQAESVPGFTVF